MIIDLQLVDSEPAGIIARSGPGVFDPDQQLFRLREISLKTFNSSGAPV
jgi:hypothetical protein